MSKEFELRRTSKLTEYKREEIYYERKQKTGGWPIEDDELDNVSGGMRPSVNSNPCPKCGVAGNYTASSNEYKCDKCGCRWNADTGEILN